ncbi:MAG TPA: alpha/beta hydrolase [Dactylosporangium sp.]|nr:alpha/beta hydrolase [Dactylosporangium sp.]
MPDVEELKQFVTVHAGTQNIPPSRYRPLLERIRTDEDGAPGSWTAEWSREAERWAGEGDLLRASRHYAMARFPYADGPARQEALRRCVSTFDEWRRANTAIQRHAVDTGAGTVHCLTTPLRSGGRRPVLLVMGGIVTVKEQWAPILLQAGRLGMHGVVAEMPGVGENTTRYGADSWRQVTAVLDSIGHHLDVSETYLVALSFSGHMALRCATTDERIRGIVTSGAPVADFFTDAGWQARLPRITVDTLTHLTGMKEAALFAQLPAWRLDEPLLDALDIPVHYLASRRDEIIPAADPEMLHRHLRRFHLMEHDDVHGSPNHVLESRLWVVLSLLRMRRARAAQRAVLGLLLGAARAGSHLRRAPR